jgi:hypothetical protein
MTIPFNKPYLTGRETACLERVFANLQFSGDGQFTSLFFHEQARVAALKEMTAVALQLADAISEG